MFKHILTAAVCLFCVLFLSFSGLYGQEKKKTVKGLLNARRTFKTRLLPHPDDPPVPPKDIFSLVYYSSDVGDLPAYITPNPGNGKRYPAVLWCHGGFSGLYSYLWDPADADNDQSASAFRRDGMVLMCPSVRGENNNPGRLELFYGEVSDILSAINYLKKVPYVDPNRVYLAGHSSGGTLALLVSTAVSDIRAVFSFGGAPDIGRVVSDGEGYGNTPYDYTSEMESTMRSAIAFTGAIRIPCFYFEGEESSYVEDVLRMDQIARTEKVPFQAFIIKRGTHFNILSSITQLVSDKILDDKGSMCRISFTSEEIQNVFDRGSVPVSRK